MIKMHYIPKSDDFSARRRTPEQPECIRNTWGLRRGRRQQRQKFILEGYYQR